MRARVQSLVLATAVVVVLGIAAGAARAQQSTPSAGAAPPAGRDTPRPEELEPAVDTTHTPPAAGAQDGSAARDAGSSADTRGTQKPPAGATAPTPTPAPPTPAQGAAAKPGAKKGPDRLQLDTTEITGNRELPKVLYIVPWKRSDLGDLAGRPVNSLLDEVLQPLDRDVFTRENRYYDALKPDRAGSKADTVQGSGDKP